MSECGETTFVSHWRNRLLHEACSTTLSKPWVCIPNGDEAATDLAVCVSLLTASHSVRIIASANSGGLNNRCTCLEKRSNSWLFNSCCKSVYIDSASMESACVLNSGNIQGLTQRSFPTPRVVPKTGCEADDTKKPLPLSTECFVHVR